MSSGGHLKGLPAAFALALAVLVSASSAIPLYIWRRKWGHANSKIEELQKSLNSALEKCAAERQGRIRAQQDLRKALTQSKSESLETTSYPMAPIGIIQSCFSTRNGTPRQPLLVPLARACLVFDPARVPPASLEGLEEYSHCWIIYVFHLNTDLEKLWKQSSKSKFKAKVEGVRGHMLLLSGVDLVDGTPVLDIKPYLPYCDCIEKALVPNWVNVDNLLAVASVSFSEDFSSSLIDCWKAVNKNSLYASPNEVERLVEQVLSWDIRSVSQRNGPHDTLLKKGNGNALAVMPDLDDVQDEEASEGTLPAGDIIYHLVLEGMDFSYRIDGNGNVIVDKVVVSSDIGNKNRCNYLMWEDKLR